MKWMEFIKVQTTKADTETELQDLLAGHTQCQGLLEAKVFRNAYVDDCSILLVWDADSIGVQGSGVGQYLRNILKQYGLVDYSVWVEKEKREKRTS